MSSVFQLHHGCCKLALKGIESNSIDLIYMDPPFTPTAYYDDGRNMWKDVKDVFGVVTVLKTYSPPKFYNFFANMQEVLYECRRVLKDTGSIYVHCDIHTNAYLKLVLMDMFGYKNMINEIVWQYFGPTAPCRKFPQKHDYILFFAKDCRLNIFNADAVRVPYKNRSISSVTGGRNPSGKRRLPKTQGEKDNAMMRFKRGKVIESCWGDIGILTTSLEKVGYPTQKPLALMERIILASSNPGQTVLDPFMGSGTTGVAALKHGRKFIGCDVSEKAITIARKRLIPTQHGES